MRVLLIFAFNFILYFRTIFFSIIVDDVRHYKMLQSAWWPSLKERGYNIFAVLSERLYSGGTFGTDPRIDHAFTIFLTSVIGSLIYVAFGANDASFWMAILYCCHPINNQITIWLNGRRYAMNVILVLGMVILASTKFWPLCLVLYPMTGMFHATAFFAPLLFIKYALFLIPVAFLFLLFHGMVLRKKYQDKLATIMNEDFKKMSWRRLIVCVKCFGFYFFKMLLPGTTLMIYPTLYFWGVTPAGNKNAYSYNWEFIKGVLAIGLSIAILPLIGMEYLAFWLFMILSIVQWCAILPGIQTLADRYTSVANVFMMFFLVSLVGKYFPTNENQILTGIALYYIARLSVTKRMYVDFWAYWEYHLYHAPYVPTPRKFYVSQLINTGDYVKAFAMVKDGLKHNPTDFSLLQRAAICAKSLYSRQSAKEYLAVAENNPYIGHEEEAANWIKAFRKTL